MVLAHRGGWDEIVLVIAPVGLFTLLLWVANHKAARLNAQAEIDETN
jgi:hypothetical protein